MLKTTSHFVPIDTKMFGVIHNNSLAARWGPCGMLLGERALQHALFFGHATTNQPWLEAIKKLDETMSRQERAD